MVQKTERPIETSLSAYSIIQDLKNTQANITFGQLINIAPSVRAELSKGLRRPKDTETTANTFGNQTKLTALCCAATVNNIPITLIVDSGASGSVVSKAFLDEHKIHVERASTTIMTGITGSRIKPIGAIDNFPVTVAGLTMPVTVDVTEALSYSVIVGNDWLTKVKAVIDYQSPSLTINVKGRQQHIPCTINNRPGELITPPPRSTYKNEEYKDSSDKSDESSYLYNETELVGSQERPLGQINWGKLQADEMRYFSVKEKAHPTKQGITIDQRLYSWQEIQAIHGRFQMGKKKKHKHWHGPSARCWCNNPLYSPTDQCNNC
jgi:hypothetical protein